VSVIWEKTPRLQSVVVQLLCNFFVLGTGINSRFLKGKSRSLWKINPGKGFYMPRFVETGEEVCFMHFHPGEGIALALRQVEMLKSEVLTDLADLFAVLIQEGEERITASFAKLVVSILLLARRMGINYRDLKRIMVRDIHNRLREEEQEEIRRDLYDLKGLLEIT